jgi:hypothetical protein
MRFDITLRGNRSVRGCLMRLKCFKQRWIFDPAKLRARVMRCKRLKRRMFSLPLAHREARLAFGLPQRA